MAEPGAPLRPVRLRPPVHGDVARVERLLAAACGYLVRTWLPGRGLADGHGLPGDTAARDDAVRACGSAVLALAVVARLPSVPVDGVPPVAPAPTAPGAQAARLAALAVAAHRSGSPGGWGGGWQSALWAAQLGLGAWLLPEGAIGGDVRAGLRGLLADEADAVAARAVDVLRDVDGRVVRPGDSPSEELSWDARLLSLTAVLLADDPRVTRWRAAAVARQVTAYAVPDDLVARRAAREPVHGWPLAAWLPGSSLEPDGSVVNHGVVHPGYMRSPHAVAAVLHDGLAGGPPDPAALRGAHRLQECLTDRVWPSPPYAPPGGTCYATSTPAVYRPQGDDWGGSQPLLFWLQDLQASLLRLDAGCSVPASAFLDLRLSAVEAEVARGGDGRVYPDPGDFVSGLAEPDAAAKLAEAWLCLALLPGLLPHHDGTDGDGTGGEGTGGGGSGTEASEVLEPPSDARPPARFLDTDGEEGRAVAWLVADGVLRGVDPARYAPRAPLSRVQLVVALHRRAGSPVPPDGPTGASEREVAVTWAVGTGLLRGRADGDLDLGAPVRRDALAVVLWREAGRPVAPPPAFADVPAGGEVGRAVGWAASTGLLQGRGDAFDPAGVVDRGAAALALVRRRPSSPPS